MTVIYPERSDDTVRFSALDALINKYRDSQVVVVNRETGEETPITCAVFIGGRLLLGTGGANKPLDI